MIIAYKCVCGLLVLPGRVCPCGEVMRYGFKDSVLLFPSGAQIECNQMADGTTKTQYLGNEFQRDTINVMPGFVKAYSNVNQCRVYMPLWVERLLNLVGFSAAALVLAVVLASWWSR